jgi:hypothetical protein
MQTFNTQKILEIYNKHVIKSTKYYEKFNYINKYLSKEELEIYKKIDPPRVISILDFKEWIYKYNIFNGNKLLYTCESDPELNYINYKHKTYLSYPPYDLHSFDIEEKKYDFVIFNQTIEHLYNPFIAMQNFYNHMNSGAFLYTTVPTINIPHMTPIHFWGVTPIGLCLLAMSVGLEILECGHWGTQKYLDYIFHNNNWPGYEDISINYNMGYDPVCQAQTWILAKKI